jgi:hypothetical protein
MNLIILPRLPAALAMSHVTCDMGASNSLIRGEQRASHRASKGVSWRHFHPAHPDLRIRL